MSIRSIVTGHSRGLGAAIADELRRRGCPVLGLSRQARPPADPDAGTAVLEQVALDLADAAAVAAWCAGPALRRFLDGASQVVLVNNAGVVQPIGPVATQPPDEVARAVALNVTAPLLLAGAVCRASPQAREHRIAHVSSGAARNAYAGWSVYGATKAALDQHARAVVLDAVPGLRICSLAPGVVDTDMQGELRATPIERFPQRGRFEALKAAAQLVPPAVAARRFVDHLLSDAFGREPVADLRSLGAG